MIEAPSRGKISNYKEKQEVLKVRILEEQREEKIPAVKKTRENGNLYRQMFWFHGGLLLRYWRMAATSADTGFATDTRCHFRHFHNG